MSVRVLFTCFEPFGGRAANTSMRVLAPMLASPPDGIAARVLPVDFSALRRVVPRLGRSLAPERWVMVGEDGESTHLRCERIAVNLLYGEVPDNRGLVPDGRRAVRDGPDAYFTTLDPERLRAALLERDVPAELSNSAGTYACNLALYLALHHNRRHDEKMEIGFIHVPRHYRRTGRTLKELRAALLDLAASL